ncbi:MAG: HypC/HybG/HupF family hydrogenase formation chaperone [Ectothiorhodospiraceae bacterium]|jgi:hydrogenase assembly chaperone HypC/HupF|nr:HypC/HybG/HupF family hydrogenase formation chaperone [Ectothiorhodospiraceae bacterium]
MCIGIPMQVQTVDGLIAHCRRRDDAPQAASETVDLSLVGAVEPGDWLLVHLGSARERLTAEAAAQVGDALLALEAALRGESVDHLFADLIDREPELPAFLRVAAPANP